MTEKTGDALIALCIFNVLNNVLITHTHTHNLYSLLPKEERQWFLLVSPLREEGMLNDIKGSLTQTVQQIVDKLDKAAFLFITDLSTPAGLARFQEVSFGRVHKQSYTMIKAVGMKFII